jgi:hypothetical protein
MTTVGFIGSGNIGVTVARLAIGAGYHVVLSNSRGPDTLAVTAAELGPRASAATSGEAAAAGDIVVVTVPVKSFPDMPAAPLAGKTVIDTCNYGPERDGHIAELDSTSLTSSELLLRYISDAMLVKAFNNIFFKHLLSLARPAGAADRSYLPIAGDSARAKAAVTEFIESIGYSVVDAGSLAESWRQATGTPVWGTPYGSSSMRRASRSTRTPSARRWPPQRGDRRVLRARAPGAGRTLARSAQRGCRRAARARAVVDQERLAALGERAGGGVATSVPHEVAGPSPRRSRMRGGGEAGQEGDECRPFVRVEVCEQGLTGRSGRLFCFVEDRSTVVGELDSAQASVTGDCPSTCKLSGFEVVDDPHHRDPVAADVLDEVPLRA